MSMIATIVRGRRAELTDFLAEKFALDQANPDSSLEEQLHKLSVKQNLLYVKPTDKKTLGVEDADRIIEFASRKPHLSSQATAVVDSLNIMNFEAQNKLLKLIEEPPAYLAIYLLDAHDEGQGIGILQTIHSRCQTTVLSEQSSNRSPAEISQLGAIAASFFGSDAQLKASYTELRALTDKGKGTSASEVLLSLLNQLNDQIAARLQTQVQPREVEKLAQMEQTVNYCFRAVSAHVNTRLIVDKLFLDALSIV